MALSNWQPDPVMREFITRETERARLPIFLEGAHSTGKSTLAPVLKQRLSCMLIPEPVRPILDKYGISSQYEGKTVEEICDIQWEIFHWCRYMREQAHPGEYVVNPVQLREGAWIADRSPVSVYAYTLFLCGRNASCQASLAQMQQIVAAYASLRTIHIVTPPNIKLDRDRHRQEPCPQHRWHMHYLILGILEDFSFDHYVLEEYSFEKRQEEALNVIWERQELILGPVSIEEHRQSLKGSRC